MKKLAIIFHGAHGHTHAGVPYEEAANRLGSWSGLMAQAGHASAPDAFPAGDIRTARMFGRNFALALHRMAEATAGALEVAA